MRPQWIVTAGLAAACILSGCGSGSSSSSSAASSAAPPPASATIAWSAPIDGLDPLTGFANQALAAMHLFGGNLYDINSAGTTVPGLAASSTTSSDGLTWTFKLRPGLKFSDGTPLTSADVKATIDRAKADKANGYAGLFAPINSVDAPDPQTVVFHLTRPYTSLPTVLGEPEFMILPTSGLKEGKNFFNKPTSAGPYVLQSWGGGNNSTYVVNRNYWGPKPVIKTIKFTTIPDFNSRLAQLQSGQIQSVVDLPPSVLPQLQSSATIHAKVVQIYGFGVLNMYIKTAPLNNLNLRKAISLAIDRTQIAKDVWNGQNKAYAGFWPPTMAGYDPSISTAQNLTEAKALVAKSPCAGGCTLKMQYTDSYPSSGQTALIIQSNLNQIGIKTQLVSLDNSIWFNNMYNGKYQLSVSNLYDYANVPDGMVAYAIDPAGGLNANYSGWDSKSAIAAGNKAIVTSGAARAQALADVNTQFLKDQPYATINTYAVVYASSLPENLVTLTASEFVDVKAGK
jgi:ABC-type transport system substrate-binding protein